MTRTGSGLTSPRSDLQTVLASSRIQWALCRSAGLRNVTRLVTSVTHRGAEPMHSLLHAAGQRAVMLTVPSSLSDGLGSGSMSHVCQIIKSYISIPEIILKGKAPSGTVSRAHRGEERVETWRGWRPALGDASLLTGRPVRVCSGGLGQ